jgi:acyl-CoA thioesterase FadM
MSALPADVRDEGVAAAQPRLRALLGLADDRVFVWARRVPYFHAGFFAWASHTAFLRQIEEVVDRFLLHAGLSIGELCRDRRWIPVVQEHSLEMRAPVGMEEVLFTTFRVVEIVASRLFRARVGFWVVRDGRPVEVATATITHGYVEVREPHWESRLVRLDPETLARLERWTTPSPADATPARRAG